MNLLDVILFHYSVKITITTNVITIILIFWCCYIILFRFSGDNEKDDLPCELCEQLVGHLKELLVANTTEEEFDMVLEGLCKQTGKFSTECLSLVHQYYHEIYQYLVNELNSSEVCTMIGICHPSSVKVREGLLIKYFFNLNSHL